MALRFQWEFRPRWAASLERRLTGLLHPGDSLRQRMTRDLEVDTSDHEVQRSAEVEALVTISDPRRLGDVEVGLVCTEYYARYSEGVGTDDAGGRVMTYDVAHEAWLTVDSVPGVQSVRLPIPPEAPFSYDGDCLSFRWEVVARGRRKRRLDAQVKRDITVLP